MEFFTFEVDVAGVRRKMHLLAAAAGDLQRPLARSSGYMRAKAHAVFAAEGPGWEPLKESTLERKPATERPSQFLAVSKGGKSGPRTVTSLARKIERGEQSLKRASRGRAARIMERLAAQRAQLQHEADWLSEGERRKFTPETLVAFSAAEIRRKRLHHAARTEARKAASREERRRLAMRHKRRYMASPSAHRMLGALDRTITFKLVGGKSVEIFSKAYIGAIHNYGGVAGRGAKIPARPFMYLDEKDLEAVVSYFKEHLLLAWLR